MRKRDNKLYKKRRLAIAQVFFDITAEKAFFMYAAAKRQPYAGRLPECNAVPDFLYPFMDCTYV